MPKIGKKLKELETLDAIPPPDMDFAQLLRRARLRAAAGNPIPQSPITDQMLDDPVNGEFWRLMKEARERVARLQPPT